jgi:chromosome segregation ATPase
MADDFDINELPDPARDYIKALRAEAAQYRVERNNFRDKYTEAGTLIEQANQKVDQATEWQTKYSALETTNGDLEKQIGRLTAAAKYGIPEEVDRLKGSTPEEWEEDAKSLSEKFGSGKPTGLAKDPAAKEKPEEPKDDPIKKAFRDAGIAL